MINTGYLSVLNVGAGDIKLNFNSSDPMEVERARRIVNDMLQRGYVIFVEDDDGMHRVESFDEKTDTYIIADGALYQGDANEQQTEGEAKKPATRQKWKRKVSAKTAKRTTGIAPTAGG